MNTFDKTNGAEMLQSLKLGIDIEKEKIPVITMPKVDVKKLTEEDKDEKDTLKPFKFGYEIDVDIDIKKDGFYKEFQNGDKLWLLKIHSHEALSINLIYDNFYLSKGSEFFIYNEDKTEILGAYTPELYNNSENIFATGIIQGSTVVLEYYEPEAANGVIRINKVIHGFRALNDSAPCNIDVMCALGNNWTNERRSICLIIMGGSVGSGCLINNTSKNYKPYILTARHNFFDDNNTGDTPNRNPTTSVFRFKFWKPSCGTGNPLSPYQEYTGANLRAQYRPSDFALLELTARPINFNLYYAGWDRTTAQASNATCIHHPMGDAMKISYAQNPATAVTWPGFSSPTGALDHWRVTFNQGIVQHGSSGSPLFNPSKRIVGQLHGNQNNICAQGNNDCFCNQQVPVGEYGKFDVSWDRAGASSANRLRDWLDPLGANPNYLDGINEPYISGPITLYYSGTEYTLNDPPAGTLTWGVTGDFTIIAVSGTNKARIVRTAYSTNGIITAYVNNTAVATFNISAMTTVLITGPNTVYAGQNDVAYQLPYEQGATYDWNSQGILSIVSNGFATSLFNVPVNASGFQDNIVCVVTLNGYFSHFYNMVVNIL